MIETIEWVPVAERLPDDEITVLLYTPVQGGDVWPGWRGKTLPPDGPMYKALGNSMAVPVMRWIGEQIQLAAA